MEQRLENSTLIALRELRSYEKERQLAERRKQEEEARQARERKERERQVEEAAREQVLEKQLRTDLQHAEEEIHLLKQEADLRLREANHALQALQALASVPQASDSPVKAPSLRRGTWLAASGCTALLASALVLVIGLRRDPSTPVQDTRQTMSCPGSSTSAQLPSSAAAETTTTVSKPRPPTPHPQKPGLPHTLRKPNPPKPICDGTDPLCGLTVNSMAP